MTKITRRHFLKAAAVTALGAAVAACAQPTPTVAPIKPAAAPTNTPAPAAPAAPTATTKPPEPTKPFAVAPTNTPPAATLTPIPKSAYKEAPMLAELVKAGKLPPVDQRLPQEVMVIDPVEKTGKYGGILNMLTTDATGVGAGWNYAENFLKWQRDWSGHRPNLLSKWAWNADGTELTLYLRKGIKWSDGKPLTWDDWLFWFHDMVEDPKIALPRQTGTHPGGKAMTTKKMDDFTLVLNFAVPNPLILENLSRGTGARASSWQVVPAHYMKQFHYKYNSALKDTDTKALLDRYNSPSRYTFYDMPCINPWVVKELKQREYSTLERNPYYWKVDKEGNQLPYIDKVQYKFMADQQTYLLACINGETDFGSAGVIKDIATVKAGEAKGNYKMILYKVGDNIQTGIIMHFCIADKGLRDLIWNQKFRYALSLAIDRNKVNDVVFLGMGKPRQATQMPYGPEFQTERGKKVLAAWEKHVADYKPEEAKKLLDEIGVKDVNNDGWRERPDGSPLEIIIDTSITAIYGTESMKLVRDDYQKIGLKMIINSIESTVLNQRVLNCESAFRERGGTAGGLYIAQSFWTPVEDQEYCIFGQPYGKYYQTGGKQGIAPPPGTFIEKLVKLYDAAVVVVDSKKRDDMVLDGYQIHIDEGPFIIGIVGDTVGPYVVKNTLKNVQGFGLTGSGVFTFPFTMDPEQWYKEG